MSHQSADTDALFRSYREHQDRRTRNELIDRHVWLARMEAGRLSDRGEPFDDLHQVALYGLLRAVERFQPERGVPFPAFARATIKGELRRHFRDRTWSVHVPRPTKDLQQRLAPTRESLGHELGRSPRPAEVAHRLGVSTDAVLQAMQAQHAYRPAGTVDHAVGSSRGVAAHQQCHEDSSTERILLQRLIAELPSRDRRIVELRFFGELSQSDIARQVGLSQVQVSRRLRSILLRLRDRLAEPAVDARDDLPSSATAR